MKYSRELHRIMIQVRLQHLESVYEDTAAGRLVLLLSEARQAALLVEQEEDLETWKNSQNIES